MINIILAIALGVGIGTLTLMLLILLNYLNKRASIKYELSKILELDHNLPEKLLEKDLYSMGIDDHSESDCYD